MKINILSRKKKAIFICQVTENHLKVIKCLLNNSKTAFCGLEIEAVSYGMEDKKIAEKLNRALKKLEYNNGPFIISLPRNQATLRQIKIPAQAPQEIERILSLQASRYLPYAAGELVTGYQVISADKEGYSNVNLVIAHKDTIERYLRILRELNIKNFSVLLSSYGICNLYGYLKQNEPQPTMVIDIDADSIELAVVSNRRLLFSRYFKLERLRPDWGSLFIEEIKKTQEVYAKEAFMEAPHKIAVLGTGKAAQELAALLKREFPLLVETLPYYEKVNTPQSLLNSVLSSDNSFASLVGLGIEGPLNLLPQGVKEGMAGAIQRKEQLRLAVFISGIIFIWLLGIAKNLDNKAGYLKRIKTELNKVAAEAMPLEEIEKRARLLEGRAHKRVSGLDVLYQLHQAIPPEIALVNFNYEEASEVTMRGEAPELDFVFTFVSELSKSSVFRNFNVKVRYANKKKAQSGEVIDFEIACSKK